MCCWLVVWADVCCCSLNAVRCGSCVVCCMLVFEDGCYVLVAVWCAVCAVCCVVCVAWCVLLLMCVLCVCCCVLYGVSWCVCCCVFFIVA